MFLKPLLLEACVDSVISSVRAEQQGAHQIELCGRLDLDGLTPDLDLIAEVINTVNIPIKVMLRNRGGNFIYSKKDVEAMKFSLAQILRLDIQGIVFGALLSDDTIDVSLTQEICDLAGNIPVTFHKAIDSCSDILQATKVLKQTRVTSILSSGGKPTAMEGAEVLKEMINMVKSKVEIISAGKITSDNISEIHQRIGGTSYHGKLIVGSI